MAVKKYKPKRTPHVLEASTSSVIASAKKTVQSAKDTIRRAGDLIVKSRELIDGCREYNDLMKTEPHTSEEFTRFKKLLTGLMAVPRSELKEKMDEYDREKKKRQRQRKRAKTSPASRASNDREH